MPPKGLPSGRGQKSRRTDPADEAPPPPPHRHFAIAPNDQLRQQYLLYRAVQVVCYGWSQPDYEVHIAEEVNAVNRCGGRADWTVLALTDDVWKRRTTLLAEKGDVVPSPPSLRNAAWLAKNAISRLICNLLKDRPGSLLYLGFDGHGLKTRSRVVGTRFMAEMLFSLGIVGHQSNLDGFVFAICLGGEGTVTVLRIIDYVAGLLEPFRQVIVLADGKSLGLLMTALIPRSLPLEYTLIYMVCIPSLTIILPLGEEVATLSSQRV
jgi:hypothetical protein